MNWSAWLKIVFNLALSFAGTYAISKQAGASDKVAFWSALAGMAANQASLHQKKPEIKSDK